MQELEIRALPADLPHHINVDVSSIKEIGDSVFIKDLDFGKGVKILVESETVVATVIELAKEEEIKPEVKVEDISNNPLVENKDYCQLFLRERSLSFEEFKNGEGFIAVEPRSSNVSITNVYLGYYLAEEFSNYLQPVYVFEGPGFAGMIAAIKSEFVEK